MSKKAYYKQLEREFRNYHKSIMNPYVNDMEVFEDAVYNYDNTILFNYRYLDQFNNKKRSYRKNSLLFNYCTRVADTHFKAIRIFISFGKLGILDVVDLLESEEYIINTDPVKITDGYGTHLYPPAHKDYLIAVLNLVKNGISLV